MTGRNPVHTYRFPRVYTINLTVMKPDKKSGSIIVYRVIKTDVVTVTGVPFVPPVANFMADIVKGTAPLQVKFADRSTGSPTFFNYDFGDGANMTGPNPAHTYRYPGNYTVTLTVIKSDAVNSTLVSNSSVRKDFIIVHAK